MIRNRLSELLTVRNLKISRVANDIGTLSRNTINSIANNKTKMIQMDTINLLCQYLNIAPSEFFEFKPFDLNVKSFVNDDLIPERVNGNNIIFTFRKFKIELYIKESLIREDIVKNGHTFDLTIAPNREIFAIPFYDDDGNDPLINTDMFGNVTNPDEYENNFDFTFDVLLGHIDDNESYEDEKDDFIKLWNSLGAGFQTELKDKIERSVAGTIIKSISEISDKKINTSRLQIGFSFSFENAYNFKYDENAYRFDDYKGPTDLPF